MSSRRHQDMSSRRFQDVFSVTIFRLPRRLQDVLQDVFKTSSRRLCKTSSRRLQDVLEDIKLFRWRRVEDVLKTSSRPTNVCWVIIKPMTYFEKQFSKIICSWWGREGIWTYIFETDKSSFHLLAQPWSWCAKSVAPLGALVAALDTIFSHKSEPAEWGLRNNLVKSRNIATLCF